MAITCAYCRKPIEGPSAVKDHSSFHSPKCIDLYTLRLRLMRKLCREPDEREMTGYSGYIETWGRVPSFEELADLPPLQQPAAA
jgi:hypothetical protein